MQNPTNVFFSSFQRELSWTELRTDIKASHKALLGDESIRKVIIFLD